MPTYDFKCPKCGEKFTEMVSIAKRKDVRCPKCGSVPEQLITGVSICGCGDNNSCSTPPAGGGMSFG